ncbi:MAG: peptide ligase PGM1-related protein [Polyangiaceae bacterium]
MSLQLADPRLPGSEAELQARFETLQQRLVPLWKAIESLDDDGEQTIVVVPSLTVDFAALEGSLLQAYEERFLFLLLLLRQPSARLIYVTSAPIQPNIVDYYLGLLPGVVVSHARRRLHLVAPCDGAPQPLSLKLLQRPRLLAQIRGLIPEPSRAHLVPFNTTRYERDLALRLGIPMYAADPKTLPLGTKSGARKLFRESGLSLPAGFEDLDSEADVLRALVELKRMRPQIRQAMVKHDDGVSGEGNAVVDLQDVAAEADAIRPRLTAMKLEAKHLSVPQFLEKLAAGRGIVEERVLGTRIESPSVQMRVTPLGRVELLSTHDQLLGGSEGQKYEGCVFPAAPTYARPIAEEAAKVGPKLIEAGVLGRFAIDFVCAEQDGTFEPYAIELNLRKGGTTHPYLTLQFLTNGSYDAASARFLTEAGAEKHYVASDALSAVAYRSLTVDDLFDIAVRHRLHYDPVKQTGVVFHMMSAIGDRGRFGLTAVESSRDQARTLYDRTQDIIRAAAESACVHQPLPDV